MTFSSQGFPIQKFLSCIRNNRSTAHEFMIQVNGLKTQWIYQIIKLCYNMISQVKQLPLTKLSALQMIRDLMQTCQVPCINLIEVYILPMIYEIAIEKPQESRQKRGYSYFQQQAKTNKNTNIEEIGSKFVGLCEQMIFVGALIKPKRIFENSELNKKSDFEEYFEKLQKYQIVGIPNTQTDIKYFQQQFLGNSHRKYLTNLQKFMGGKQKNKQNYCEYFMKKIIQSLESVNNPLFNTGGMVMNQGDLDMRKLLKSGDTSLNQPLIQQLLLNAKKIDNFVQNKNYLSLLFQFVKWGHAEVIWKLCTNNILFSIGKRILEVKGEKGLIEGQNIYPEIKDQKQAKRKYYFEYLKSFEVFIKCLAINNLNIEESSKIIELYETIKKQRKFDFPQNLMLKKIETDFQENIKNNQERNIIVLYRLRQDSNQPNKKNKNKSVDPFITLNKQIESCFEQFFKIPKKQSQVVNKLTKFLKFKQYFDNVLDKLQQLHTNLKQQQVQQILENGLELTKNIEKFQQNYQKLKNGSINFRGFCQEHDQLVKYYEDNISKTSKSSSNRMNSNKNIQIQLKNQVETPPNMQRHPTFSKQTYFINPQLNKLATKPNSDFQQKKKNSQQKIQPLFKTPINQNSLSETSSKMNKKQSKIQQKSSNINQDKSLKSPEFILSNQNPPLTPLISPNENPQFILTNNDQIIGNRVSKTSIQNQQKSLNSQFLQGSIVKEMMNIDNKQSNNLNALQANMKIIQNTNELNRKKTTLDNLSCSNQQSIKAQEKIQTNQYGMPNSFNPEKPNQTHQPFRIGNKIQQKANTLISSVPVHASSINNIQTSSRASATFILPEVGSPLPLSNGIKTSSSKQIGRKFSPQSSNMLNNQLHFSKTAPEYPTENKEINGVFFNPEKDSHHDNLRNINNSQNKQSIQIQSPTQPKQLQDLQKDSSSISDPSRECQQKKLFQSRQISEQLKSSKQSFVKNYHNTNNQPCKVMSKYSSQVPSCDLKAPQCSRLTTNVNQFDKDDEIKEPEQSPLNYSYYAFEQMQKNQNHPKFKDCFRANTASTYNTYNTNYKNSQISEEKYSSQLHQQYLIAKLSRWQSTQKQHQSKQLQNHILQLKRNTSKLKNQLREHKEIRRKQSCDSNYNSSQKSSGLSSQYVYFTNLEQSNNKNIVYNKYNSSRKSNSSHFLQSTLKQGILISNEIYEPLFIEQKNQVINKACLQTKSLIIKNQLCQVGYMMKKTLQNVKLVIYFTPFQQINRFSYSISKEPNLQIQSYCKQYPQITANKQIKIQINATLKNIPYFMPLMNLQFIRGIDRKNIYFYLPLPIHRFVDVKGMQKSQVEKQLQQNISNLKRVNEFKINPNVFRHRQLMEYFPNFTNISENLSSHTQKYTGLCSLKNWSFIIIITLIGKQRMLLQGIPKNENFVMEYFMMSVKKIIQLLQ